MTKLISIIIPAYNIEKYLAQCLESILICTPKRIEIIIVNDGSTDDTGKIANQFANKYIFIKVIHQVNQGVSAARNNGLSVAKGDYIWFVDGDDILISVSEVIEICNICLKKNIDMIVFKVNEFREKELKNILTKNKHIAFNYRFFENNLSYLIAKNQLTYFPVDKIIRKNLINYYHLKFPLEYSISEDFYWNCRLLPHINSYCFIDENIYYYRVDRIDSATYQLNDSKLSIILSVIRENIEFVLYNSRITIEDKKLILLYISKVWFFLIPESYYYSKEFFYKNINIFEQVYQIFIENNISLYPFNKGAKIFSILINIFGFKLGLRLYSIVISIKRKKKIEL